MSIKTRFAPSPTGLLHVGNARAALFCWLFAKGAGGQFILRYDDTDTARSSAAHAEAIAEDLHWLGITADAVARQSDRFALYETAFADLQARGLVYACYETPEELEKKRKRQLARGKPPVYDRAALSLSQADKAALEADGHAPHWRFKLSGAVVAWDDLIRGAQKIDTASLSDPVLRRADGTWLYTLPSVVDDMDMGITHILRGEDHVANTGVQAEIFAALGGALPHTAHFSLLVAADGGALSKRLGSLSLQNLREQGFEPMALNSLIARLGSADPILPVQDMKSLTENFDLTRLGRAPARFDEAELARLNARVLHEMDFSHAAPRLAEMGLPQDEKFWLAVRENLTLFADIADFKRVIDGPITPLIAPEDKDYVTAALDSLPSPITDQSWTAWTAELKTATGRKGRELFMPLRLALTGRAQGPEMQDLLPLIGYDKACARLRGDII